MTETAAAVSSVGHEAVASKVGIGRILVAVDGSQMADNALSLALQIAKKYSAPVDLVHINTMPSELVDKAAAGYAFHPLTSESDKKAVENRELARAVVLADEAMLLERKKSLESSGIECKEISVSSDTSDAAPEIVRVSGEGEYDLVALGSRGMGGTRSFLLGSVSKSVVSNAKCSVLVSKIKSDSVQRILLAYDGSESSKRALAFVSDLAKKFNSTVKLISVISSQMISSEFVVSSAIDRLDEEMRQDANQAVSELKASGVIVEDPKIVGASDIAYAIKQEAEAGFYDLIALGNRGWGKVKSFFLGSVASGVLDSAKTNVLVVK